MNVINTSQSAVNYFFWALLIAAFVVETWAFVDAIRVPSAAFTAAGKQTKQIWLIILGVAFVIGIGGAVGLLTLLSFLPILAFVAAHERVFVIEQNRDAQLRTLLITEGNLDPAKVVPVLHYDGTPITARFILSRIADQLDPANVTPLRKVVS